MRVRKSPATQLSETTSTNARSVVLSALLGYHPPELPISALVRIGALFGMADRTIRTAVSRMVSNGDLDASDGVYSLTQRGIDHIVTRSQTPVNQSVPVAALTRF